MSVIFYGEGEHRGGFVGYRVSRSVGGKTHEHYFSLRRYSKEEAKALAYEKDEALRVEAERLRAERKKRPELRAEHVLLDTQDPSLIVRNFQAKLTHQRKLVVLPNGQKAVKYAYTYPEFVITYPKENGRLSMYRPRVDKLGFDAAFEDALRHYIKHWLPNATPKEIAKIRSLKPDRSVFYEHEYLRNCLVFGSSALPSIERIKTMCQ